MKDIYLDIDGVMILDDLENYGKPALGLSLFLQYLYKNKHKVYWLTTHCMDGVAETPLKFLKPKLEKEDYDLIVKMNIIPTEWKEFKTEGIDFSQDFLWFDDDILLQELEMLYHYNAEHKLIKIDLQKDPHQLKNIIESGIIK